jgi:hypothetical protein
MRLLELLAAAGISLAAAQSASALTVTFDDALGGSPSGTYEEAGFVFQPNSATNDVKCYDDTCLKEFRQGEITTMVKQDGGAFDLVGFYFALIGNGTQTEGVQDITVTGTRADASTVSLTFALNSLLTSFAPSAALVGADSPGATTILTNDGYIVSILGGLLDNVIQVDWTTNSVGVQSASARLDNVMVRDPAPVPVPAAGFLLAGALGAAALLRRRKAA